MLALPSLFYQLIPNMPLSAVAVADVITVRMIHSTASSLLKHSSVRLSRRFIGALGYKYQ